MPYLNFMEKNLNYTMCNSDFSTKEWKYRISNKLILFRTINGYMHMSLYLSRAVPLHAMEALWGTGDIAPTHY
jgi:hypothetical protein